MTLHRLWLVRSTIRTLLQEFLRAVSQSPSMISCFIIDVLSVTRFSVGMFIDDSILFIILQTKINCPCLLTARKGVIDVSDKSSSSCLILYWSPGVWWSHQGTSPGVCWSWFVVPPVLAECLAGAGCRLQSWWGRWISLIGSRDGTALLFHVGRGWREAGIGQDRHFQLPHRAYYKDVAAAYPDPSGPNSTLLEGYYTSKGRWPLNTDLANKVDI